MRRTPTAVLTAAVLSVGVWTVPVAASAATATVVKCGQVVTTSIRLANNLSNCHGNGLVIGANYITIDLAGHSISGVNTRGSEGIADDGHPGARIQNGTITRFFLNGVGLRGAPHSVVSNLTIQGIGAGNVDGDASAGVLVKNSPYSSVTGSRMSNHVTAFQSDGVDVLFSRQTTVMNNVIAANNWNGMFVLQSPLSRIIANTLESNGNQGMELNLGSDQSVVSGNYAAHNHSFGLVVGAVSGVQALNNMLWGNADGGLLGFDLHNCRLADNTAGGNDAGIDLEGGQFGSTGNQIVHNQLNRNVAGLFVGNGADHNVVSGNTADSNTGAPGLGGGIIVSGAVGNLVRSNVVIGNNDVGIGVFDGDNPGDTKGNVLAQNFAVNNHAHGIDAVAGTIDGGGNIARGNTPPPQCVGVVCKPS